MEQARALGQEKLQRPRDRHAQGIYVYIFFRYDLIYSIPYLNVIFQYSKPL